MKRTLILPILIVICCICSAWADISFREYDIEKAKGVAKIEDRNIVVIYSAEWCLPCKLLHEGAFSDSRLSQFMNNNFVNIEANFENADEREWFDQYKVVDIPVILILNSKGEELKRVQGLMTANIIYNTLQQYQGGGRPLIPIDYQQQYKERYKVVSLKELEDAKELAISNQEEGEEILSRIWIQFERCNSLKQAKKKRRKLKKRKKITAIVVEEESDDSYSYVVILDEDFNFQTAKARYHEFLASGIDCYLRKM